LKSEIHFLEEQGKPRLVFREEHRGRDLILPPTEFGSFTVLAWVGADCMKFPTAAFYQGDKAAHCE
jgi:hypothetical protein